MNSEEVTILLILPLLLFKGLKFWLITSWKTKEAF